MKLNPFAKKNASIYKKQIIADSEYWRELADALGWKLYGFTYRTHASFFTSLPSGHLCELTGKERDDILHAIAGKKAVTEASVFADMCKCGHPRVEHEEGLYTGCEVWRCLCTAFKPGKK